MNFHSYFRLVLEKQEKFDGHQQFFAIVQLIGTRKQAENFAYRYVVIFMVTKLRIFQCNIIHFLKFIMLKTTCLFDFE